MKCIHCGKECEREEQYCPNCGTRLGIKYNFDEIDFVFEETVECTEDRTVDNIANKTAVGEAPLEEQSQEQTWKYQHRRRKLMFGGIALFIGILVVIFSVIKQSNQRKDYLYVPISQKITVPIGFMVDGIQNIVLLRFDGEEVQTIEGDQIYNQSYSISREVAALTVDFDHKLYVVTDKDVIPLDNNVESILVSQDGTCVAYIKDVKGEVGELYRYDIKSKTSSKIASSVSVQNYRLSPDGESIAYCKVQQDSLQPELMLSVDRKEPKKVADREVPVGISNHGKYLYVRGENGFYLILDGDRIKLGEGYIEAQTRTMFNLDYTQVVYYDNGRTYLSQKGIVEQLTDGFIQNVLLPPDAGFDWNYLGISSFANHIIQKDNRLYYINDQYELKYICESLGVCQIAKNMQSLLTVENQVLYLYKNFQDETITRVKVGEVGDMMRFVANPDLSIVYYVNSMEELYSMKEDGVAKKIADNVTSEISYNYHDGFFYFITNTDESFEGDLFYSVNQEPGKKVKNIDRGMLGGMVGGVLAADFTADKHINLYAINKGEAKLILSKANNY